MNPALARVRRRTADEEPPLSVYPGVPRATGYRVIATGLGLVTLVLFDQSRRPLLVLERMPDEEANDFVEEYCRGMSVARRYCTIPAYARRG